MEKVQDLREREPWNEKYINVQGGGVIGVVKEQKKVEVMHTRNI